MTIRQQLTGGYVEDRGRKRIICWVRGEKEETRTFLYYVILKTDVKKKKTPTKMSKQYRVLDIYIYCCKAIFFFVVIKKCLMLRWNINSVVSFFYPLFFFCFFVFDNVFFFFFSPLCVLCRKTIHPGISSVRHRVWRWGGGWWMTHEIWTPPHLLLHPRGIYSILFIYTSTFITAWENVIAY